MSELVDKLKELSDLKASGALTEDEFQAAKAKILAPEVRAVAASATSATESFVQLSFDPVGTWKLDPAVNIGGTGWIQLQSSTLVITRDGASKLAVEAKDPSIGGCCYCPNV